MSALCLGESFSCFEDLDAAIKQYQTQNFCVLVTKDSRSIEAAQKRLAQNMLNPALKYNELKFACHHGGNYRKRATNKDLRETTTSKKGCPFVIHFKTREDGQQLVLKNWISDHNHEITEEIFTHHHRTRKLDKETEKEVQEMLRVDPDRRLVRHVFAEKTSKEIRMKDAHNIASRMRAPVTTSTNAVQNLCEWAEAKYPSLYMELAVDPEDSTVCGIFMQDPQMVSAFDRFPEVILMDATHKTNQQDMPLYTLLCIDGNGESQVAAAFLVQKEDEGTIRKMRQIFKERNPKYLETVVVMTDKDMTERSVIKSEMPHISLQICLFHVLRTFGREITRDKMGISSGEKSTVLAHIQELTYSHDEEDYTRRYDQLCLAMSTRIRRYFDDNWHHIRDEWVEGLKSRQMNLGVRTNNRVESFFSHLMKSLVQRGRLQDLIERYMLCLSTLRSERSHRLLQALSKVPCTAKSAQKKRPIEDISPHTALT